MRAAIPYFHASMLVTALLLGSVASGQEANKKAGQEGRELRVAVAQISVTRDIDANLKTIGRAIDKAIEEKADILLTPEGSLSGYTPQFDQAKVDKALKKVVDKASTAGLALALGTCYTEPDDGKCYNQIRFYDGGGKFLGFHSKTLRCGSMTDPPKGELNDYACRPLRTFEIKGITVGGLICNDMWANPACTPMPDPHLSQKLAEMGAKIIFQAVNGGRNGGDWSRNVFWPFHETNLRIRAQAGKLWIVTVDSCYPTNIPCSCPSGVLQPNGHWAVTAPNQGEQMVVYTIVL